jgi:hypothetical protein
MTQRRAANKKFLSNRNLLVCGFLTDSQRERFSLISFKIRGFTMSLRGGKESLVKSEPFN